MLSLTITMHTLHVIHCPGNEAFLGEDMQSSGWRSEQSLGLSSLLAVTSCNPFAFPLITVK